MNELKQCFFEGDRNLRGYMLDRQIIKLLHAIKEKATDAFAHGKRICGFIR